MTGDAEPERVGGRVAIYPRGKKRTFIADFWQNGVHRKVSLKTANRRVATERATEIAAALHQGIFRRAPAAVEVRRAADDYVVSLATDGRAPKTLVKYAGVFKVFVAFLGRKRVATLNQVTASHFDAWRVERRAARHAKTVYTESVVVKQLFKWAKTRKLVLDDPLAGIRLNKPPMVPKAGPGIDQVEAILAAADGPLQTWLAVLAMTGMRVGELQRLKPEDLDLAGNWLHVRSRPGAETKTKRSRKVPIHPRLRAALVALPKSAGAWLFTAGPSRKDPRGGRGIDPKRVNNQFARVVRSLGMPAGRESGFVVHSLRHFFETYTVNAGVPQRVIDTWLGHSSDTSMAAVYYRLLDADSQHFMAKVPFGPGRFDPEARPAAGADSIPRAAE